MKTIVLTGMMGSGKTSVGSILAEKLSVDFVDIDLEIEKIYNKKISEIFAEFGEEYFRNLESKMIKEVLNKTLALRERFGEGVAKNSLGVIGIISLGGGAFENSKTREFLLDNSCVVYLKTSPEVILNRVKNDNSRPLLCGNMKLEKINELIKKREKNYEKASFTIITDGISPQAVSEKILGVLEND